MQILNLVDDKDFKPRDKNIPKSSKLTSCEIQLKKFLHCILQCAKQTQENIV